MNLEMLQFKTLLAKGLVVTVLCHLRPPLPEQGFAVDPVPEIPRSLWEGLLFIQNLGHESTVFPTRKWGKT